MTAARGGNSVADGYAMRESLRETVLTIHAKPQ